jgi:copper(I)-binding protein
MDLHNNSRHGISIERISTPAFARAEIHETTITNGVASMRSVGSLQIAAKSQLSFAPGGLHAMLIQPLQGLVPGSTVQLEIRYNDGGLLIVAAPVLTRLDENSN